MINFLFFIFITIFIYEFINYTNILSIIRSNLAVYKKIIKLLKMKKISDLRKERILLSYSKLLFISSIKILVILTIIVCLIYILNLFSNTLFNAILSLPGIAQLSIIFIIYHLIKKKIYAKLQ